MSSTESKYSTQFLHRLLLAKAHKLDLLSSLSPQCYKCRMQIIIQVKMVENKKVLRFIGGGTIGGGAIGLVKSTFPTAILLVSTDKITLHFGLDTYIFLSHQVVFIKVEKTGINIKHIISRYPEEIIFRGFRSASRIDRDIKKMGFIPCGKLGSVIIKRDSPFSKGAIAAFVIIYGILGIMSVINISSKSVIERRNYIPGHLEITTLTILVIILFSIKYFPFIQNSIVKRERHFAEVKHIFTLMIEIFVWLLSIFITQLWRQESLNMIFGIPQLVGVIGFIIISLMPIIRASYLGDK